MCNVKYFNFERLELNYQPKKKVVAAVSCKNPQWLSRKCYRIS